MQQTRKRGICPNKIRDIRLDLGFTQEGFAEWLGCSWRAVQYWETGRHEPTPRLLRELAERTGRTPGWFRSERTAT